MLVNPQNNDNETALHCAAQYGHTEVVKALLEELTDPTMRNNKFETPLDLAALYGRLEVVKMLLSAHPNLLSCSTRKHTPLHLAARNGHKAVVQVLLDAGMDSNYQVARRAPLLAQADAAGLCVLSTFHITLTCFRLSLFCCDILAADELCGVSLAVLLVSFQGVRYSLEPLKRSACGPSQTRRVHCLPIHGPHLPPRHLFCTAKASTANMTWHSSVMASFSKSILP